MIVCRDLSASRVLSVRSHSSGVTANHTKSIFSAQTMSNRIGSQSQTNINLRERALMKRCPDWTRHQSDAINLIQDSENYAIKVIQFCSTINFENHDMF